MANGQLIADRSPSVSGPKPFYRLNIIDNLDGTCSVYVEDRANSDGVSDPAAVTAVGLQIKGSAGSTPPGGLNTQVQYNNAGVFGGISGATTDGINLKVAPGKLWTNNIFNTAGTGIWAYADDLVTANIALGQLSIPVTATGTFNVAVGLESMKVLTSGSNNVAVGESALVGLTTGGVVGNVAVGKNALGGLVSGDANIGVGPNAAGSNAGSGSNNIGIGSSALSTFTSGGNNIAIGQLALAGIHTTSNNVALGGNAGQGATGTGNVFIGNSAGSQQGAGDNKLYIANTNTTTPLIGGDFSAGTLQFNGAGGITNYRGVTLAGAGIPSISGFTSQKAETAAADANVLTVTPPAAAGTYRVEVAISVSSATNGVISWTLTYKDSNGNAVTAVAQQIFQQGTAAPNTTFTTSAAGNYYGSVVIDIDNSQTNIVVAWVGGGTTAAKMSASIERLK